jgi:flagellar basal-body rod protein FlgB
MNETFPRAINFAFSRWAHGGAMDPTQNALFALAEHRLAWADQRQALLAQNIANASMPGYQPRDARPFAQALRNVTGLTPVQTAPGHMLGIIDPLQQSSVPERPTQRSPDGNGVSLEEQLTKVADTQTMQEMTTAIYKKYLGMFSMALGTGGSGS